jgi:acyl carrier protein
LTAERFIPDQFDANGLRLYKTGDSARYLPDGNIEFLHRNDLQVKIRGYRIELEEIEGTLRRHPAINGCAVVVREDRLNDKRLVGYLTLKDHASPSSAVIKSFLKKRLPDYMIPFTFVTLEKLPLTPNGKVDRRALPAPESDGAETSTYVAPATPTEETLASIWAEVIGVKKVGVHDNFFELGGHSLLATQVVTRARAALGIELPLRTIFEMPTVSALAAEIDANGGGRAAPRAGSIGRISRRGGEPPSTTLDHLSDGEVDSLLKELLAKMASKQNPKP